ncbi:MAG: imidazoleglycerol-phosphate dehydratase HisB [Solobacterium sp.]|nr:imidazoleglycerol-phosphate dehydratase HisB [Solobacterium sp.]
MRNSEITRKTRETEVYLKLELDGSGQSTVNTGVGFLDHMLELFASHGRFDLQVRCQGDTQVDDHHSTEDIAITLGQAFAQALGDKKGIHRYGDILLPMDEALVMCAADLSGRGMAVTDMVFPTEKVGTFDTELVEEFLIAFARCAGITLHVRMITGRNSHHMIEAVFKALGRVLREAAAMDPAYASEIPSTKGVLE